MEALRAAEKFMVVGNGEATCKGCGYEYKPDKGDPDFPVARGTKFQVRQQGSRAQGVAAECNACITRAGAHGAWCDYAPHPPPPPHPFSQDISADYQCPVCGAPKDKFDSRVTVVAGFAENQRYGLGTNSMTEAQKSLLIYGSLAVFFVLFLAGYAME